jgi:hypothetical protein
VGHNIRPRGRTVLHLARERCQGSGVRPAQARHVAQKRRVGERTAPFDSSQGDAPSDLAATDAFQGVERRFASSSAEGVRETFECLFRRLLHARDVTGLAPPTSGGYASRPASLRKPGNSRRGRDVKLILRTTTAGAGPLCRLARLLRRRLLRTARPFLRRLHGGGMLRGGGRSSRLAAALPATTNRRRRNARSRRRRSGTSGQRRARAAARGHTRRRRRGDGRHMRVAASADNFQEVIAVRAKEVFIALTGTKLLAARLHPEGRPPTLCRHAVRSAVQTQGRCAARCPAHANEELQFRAAACRAVASIRQVPLPRRRGRDRAAGTIAAGKRTEAPLAVGAGARARARRGDFERESR